MAKTRYQLIQRVLEKTTGDARPFHDSHGRFWLLSREELLALPPVYGVKLIETEGENRGVRSGLIKALKGEPPFGSGGTLTAQVDPQLALSRRGRD